MLPYRLRLDWVLVVAEPGSAIPDDVAALARVSLPPVPVGDPGEERSDPVRHLFWTSDDGRCLVAAWSRDDTGSGAPWTVDQRGLTLVRGQLRRRGRPWSEPSRWSNELAAHHSPGSPGDPFAELVGDGTVLSVASDGRGVVAADRLGAAVLHRSAGSGCSTFSSSAALCSVFADPHRAPPRHDLAAAWLCHSGQVVGRATGYAGVETVEPGSTVHLLPDRPHRISYAEPWFDASPLLSTAPDDLLDVVAESILDQLTAAASLPGGSPMLDLTGGKDSRLLLAMALAGGILDRFDLFTTGGPALPDVVAASGLAAHFGRPHRFGFGGNPMAGTFTDRSRRFVEATEGWVHGWGLKLRHDGPGNTRVSGVVGEALRSDMVERAWLDRGGVVADADSVADFVIGRHRAGSADLLHTELADELDRRLREELLRGPAGAVPPERVLTRHFIRHRGARYGGPLLDLDRDHRIWALFDIHAVRAAHALEPALRQGEYVHHRLIERASPELSAFAFDGDHWAGGYVSDVRPIPTRGAAGVAAPDAKSDPGGVAATASSSTRAKPHDVITAAHSRPNAERAALFEELVAASPDHPIWDLADRDRVREVVGRLDELGPKPRRQLYGVASAYLWLDGSGATVGPSELVAAAAEHRHGLPAAPAPTSEVSSAAGTTSRPRPISRRLVARVSRRWTDRPR